jgi:transcriptional regulator with XRE-family HTH domain
MIAPQPREADAWPRAPEGAPDAVLPTSLVILRSFRGLSQEELAHRASIRPGSLSDYERGRITPGLPSLLKVLDALRLPLAAVSRCDDFQRELAALTLPERSAALDRLEGPSKTEQQEWGTQRRRSELRAEIEALASDVGRVAVRFVRLLFLVLARLDPGLGGAAEAPADPERTAT